ncbi:MAG: glucose-1-phosphate adenylyltransferase, partial [Clostridia bacterium]|nr:glucose-1-phosphate adenylyltransferase [Clostridia bacterium]
VPWEEASRFGLMITDETGAITAFEEKPKNPTSNKASMGVYMFTWSKLRKYLIEDENNEASSNDFGKDVIPAMHSAGERMFAYAFDGYWKDVGTLGSLWEANLDLLNPSVDFNLSDSQWKIYANNPVIPPHYIASTAKVERSIIAGGSSVEGNIDYSVLFDNVEVRQGARVAYSVVMPGAVIEEGAVVQYAMVAEGAVIKKGAVVGEDPQNCTGDRQWGLTVIGPGLTVGEGAVVREDVMTETDVKDGETV